MPDAAAAKQPYEIWVCQFETNPREVSEGRNPLIESENQRHVR